MKRAFSGLILSGLALAAIPEAWAAEPVALTCSGEDGKPAYTLTRKEGSTSVYVAKKLTPPRDQYDHTPMERELRLLARVKLGWQRGPLAGEEPVAAFVAIKKVGESYLNIVTKPAADGSYGAEYTQDHGDTELKCAPGPGGETLLKKIAQTPILERDEVQSYWDASLAMDCHVRGGRGSAYGIRAFGYGFGSVSAQFKQPGDRFGGGDYESMEFGTGGRYVFKSESDLNRSYSPESPSSRLYVHPGSSTTPQGEKIHQVTYVPDLKKPDQKMIDLVCRERQAYATLTRFAREKRLMPKGLPAKPGTAADINPAYCGENKPKAVEDKIEEIGGKYSRFIMQLELPDGAEINGMGRGQTRDDKHCPTITVDVSTAAGVEAARKIIGDSLEGIQVIYETPDLRRAARN